MRNTVAAVQRNQRLEQIMLFDEQVKYAKSIGIEDNKICYVLWKQMEKTIATF